MNLGLLFGQGPTLVGTGYADPSAIRVAPGQITTLFVTGLGSVFSSSESVTASSLPLPTSLAEISVSVSLQGTQPITMPILAVQQISMCLYDDSPSPSSGVVPDCLVTAITVQIPFEILPSEEGGAAELTVQANGKASQAFKIQVVTSNLHILNEFDSFPMIHQTSYGSIVTHSNGSAVTSDSPAHAGETVMIYCYGLGSTSPAVKTGESTPLAETPIVNAGVFVQFDFRPNARPSPPYVAPNGTGITAASGPAFAGLVPGQVGLYQINVKIPDTIPPVSPCSQSLGVAYNLTIDIGSSVSVGPPSFDGATICVQPQ